MNQCDVTVAPSQAQNLRPCDDCLGQEKCKVLFQYKQTVVLCVVDSAVVLLYWLLCFVAGNIIFS